MDLVDQTQDDARNVQINLKEAIRSIDDSRANLAVKFRQAGWDGKTCLQCKSKIKEKRLTAMPDVLLCTGCQGKAEQVALGSKSRSTIVELTFGGLEAEFHVG